MCLQGKMWQSMRCAMIAPVRFKAWKLTKLIWPRNGETWLFPCCGKTAFAPESYQGGKWLRSDWAAKLNSMSHVAWFTCSWNQRKFARWLSDIEREPHLQFVCGACHSVGLVCSVFLARVSQHLTFKPQIPDDALILWPWHQTSESSLYLVVGGSKFTWAPSGLTSFVEWFAAAAQIWFPKVLLPVCLTGGWLHHDVVLGW